MKRSTMIRVIEQILAVRTLDESHKNTAGAILREIEKRGMLPPPSPRKIWFENFFGPDKNSPSQYNVWEKEDN